MPLIQALIISVVTFVLRVVCLALALAVEASKKKDKIEKPE